MIILNKNVKETINFNINKIYLFLILDSTSLI